MTQPQNLKRYDLEERTLEFARAILKFAKNSPKTVSNDEIVKQLIRSAGSTGANYIEANEALSKKDFVMRIKICRKEAKETAYWLKLVETSGESAEKQRQQLIQEATEITKIFGAILEKVK